MTVQQFYSDESKWCQDSLEDGKGAKCLLGALSFCYDTKERYTAALAKLVTAVQAYTGYQSIARFNDDKDTHFSDIRLVIEQAEL